MNAPTPAKLDEIHTFLGDVPAEEYARRGAANWIIRADFPMFAFLRSTGEHVANCGLHRFNWETRVFEIGWWCRKRPAGTIPTPRSTRMRRHARRPSGSRWRAALRPAC